MDWRLTSTPLNRGWHNRLKSKFRSFEIFLPKPLSLLSIAKDGNQVYISYNRAYCCIFLFLIRNSSFLLICTFQQIPFFLFWSEFPIRSFGIWVIVIAPVIAWRFGRRYWIGLVRTLCRPLPRSIRHHRTRTVAWNTRLKLLMTSCLKV